LEVGVSAKLVEMVAKIDGVDGAILPEKVSGRMVSRQRIYRLRICGNVVPH
jgi:hypothetical protein